jgi:hypothetical protein
LDIAPLQRQGFNYLEHPLFYNYARGVMAHPDGPSYLQDDPQMLAEFPPSRSRASSMASTGARCCRPALAQPEHMMG